LTTFLKKSSLGQAAFERLLSIRLKPRHSNTHARHTAHWSATKKLRTWIQIKLARGRYVAQRHRSESDCNCRDGKSTM